MFRLFQRNCVYDQDSERMIRFGSATCRMLGRYKL
jgi:hypothetical protein